MTRGWGHLHHEGREWGSTERLAGRGEERREGRAKGRVDGLVCISPSHRSRGPYAYRRA